LKKIQKTKTKTSGVDSRCNPSSSSFGDEMMKTKKL